MIRFDMAFEVSLMVLAREPGVAAFGVTEGDVTWNSRRRLGF